MKPVVTVGLGQPRKIFLSGLRDGFPLTISIFAYGLVFGVLARQAGLTYTESLLMSGLVFAGSSQFAAVAMLSVGVSTIPIITATDKSQNPRSALDLGFFYIYFYSYNFCKCTQYFASQIL
jgi:hypothetical protein